MKGIFGALPNHVRYLDVDLNVDDLAAKMPQARYLQERRSLVICSGVTALLLLRRLAPRWSPVGDKR